MSEATLPFEGTLQLSDHIDYFRNAEDIFVYHNLFGYILKMSEDVLEFLEFFHAEPRDALAMVEAFRELFAEDMISDFLSIFRLLSCLVADRDEEEKRLLEMVPAHARWITVHEPPSGAITIFTLDQGTKKQVRRATLDAWDSALWRLVDGERTVAEMVEAMRGVPGSPVQGLEQRVLATLAQLTHCEMQVLKMSSEPMHIYKHRRHGTPPYLISTMPYERVTHIVRGHENAPRVQLAGTVVEEIPEPLQLRDRVENQLAFLYREGHSTLGGRSYGERLFELACEGGALGSGAVRILEIGGGTGDLARGFLDAMRKHRPEEYAQCVYAIVTNDAEWAALQRETLADHAVVSFVEGDPTQVDALVEERFDFAICNEFLANLETVAVRKIVSGGGQDDEDDEELEDDDGGNGQRAQNTAYIGEGDAVHLIFKYALPLDDAPADFFLNVGSLRLLGSLSKVLAPTAQAYLIEFGEMFRYPVRTYEENQSAFSQHFGHLIHAAKKLGFDTDFSYLMEALDLARETTMLATTRSQFKTLRSLLALHGVSLERRPYTAEESQGLLAAAGLAGQVREISFEPLEDRVLGIVPHALKLLRLSRGVEF